MKIKFKKACLTVAVGAGLILGAAGGADAIVNGTESANDARPYQVSLQSDGEHYCGGSVIDATTIVTAAHCIEGESASTTTIRAGVTDVTSSAGQDVKVVSITAHPSYAQNEVADIAIIKLAEPLTLGGSVQAIPLATAAQVNAATTATVSGWGALSESDEGGGSTTLLEADVPLVSDSACFKQLGTDAQLEVCAGGTGTDSCYGDSGGPLVVNSDSGLVLAGVVSWGEECGGATPGVYADVPGLTQWVKDNSGDIATNPATPADDQVDNEVADDGDFAEFDDADFDDADFAEFDDADFDDADFAEFDDADFDDADFAEFDDADFDDADFAEFDDAEYDDADVDSGLWLFLDDDGGLWAEDEAGDLWQIDNFIDEDADYGYEDGDWDYEDADYGYEDGDWDYEDADYEDGDFADADY